MSEREYMRSPTHPEYQRRAEMRRLDATVALGLKQLEELSFTSSGREKDIDIKRVLLYVDQGMFRDQLEKSGLFHYAEAVKSLGRLYQGDVCFESGSLGFEMDEYTQHAPRDLSFARRRVFASMSFNLEDPTRITYTDLGYEAHPFVDWASYEIEIPTQPDRQGNLPKSTGKFWGMRREVPELRSLSFEKDLDLHAITSIHSLLSEAIDHNIRLYADFLHPR